jgi:uncharacterized membrane protein
MLKKILPILLAIFLLFGAYQHIAAPDFYAAFIPDFIPKSVANILAAIAEAVVGITLIIPRFRKWGGLGFFLLMLAFLPIHIWDLVREVPAIGSFKAAVIRFFVQLLLIYAGWWIYKNSEDK